MADCINFNCPVFVPQTLNDCGDVAIGGADAGLLIACGSTLVDPSDEIEVAALIAADNAIVIKHLKIGLDLPSPITIDPVVACGPPKTINYDRTGTWFDANVNDANVTMYNDVLSGRSFGGLVIRECEGRVTYIDSEITFQGGRVLPNNNNEAQRFEATFAWKSQTEGSIHAEPAGIF